jgi:CDP-diacylglycerol---glycerol-3-phosphate 3-phosphatidyltransferase
LSLRAGGGSSRPPRFIQIADKLLIVGALVALVSLERLEAWVAMVIIAREFPVTVLRVAVGTQQGVVI